MTSVLYAEVNIFSIAILLIIAHKSAISDTSAKGRVFSYSVRFAAIANVFDFFWKMGVENVFAVPVPMMYFVNFMYFMCFGISGYCWFLYSETVGRRFVLENKKARILAAIPLMALAALLIISVFNGCLFTFDLTEVYRRGPLFYLQHILAYGYIVAACLDNMLWAFNSESYAHREEFFAVASFATAPLICAVFQIYFQHAPWMTLGITVAFLMVYINSLNMMVSIDPLTGIHNRRSLLRHAEERMSFVKGDERLVFFFMDLDGFKQVNDVYGHGEGDRVLKVFAAALNDAAKAMSGFCARYGGDEFAFVKIMASDENPDIVGECIEDFLEMEKFSYDLQYEVGFSIGYSEYPKDKENLKDLISLADERMYKVKLKKKSMANA